MVKAIVYNIRLILDYWYHVLQKPSFELRFLHPRFWLLWLAFGSLWLLVTLLPYRVQMFLGANLGRLLMMLVKKRAATAKRNIELCFPDMAQPQRDAMLLEHHQSVGMAIFETGIAWWWPHWRLNKLVTFSGIEHIEQANQQGKGVLLFATHSFCLEIGAQLFAAQIESIGVYRPHNNPLMEYIQVRGRMRSAGVLKKRDLRGMVKALKNGKSVWYTVDQDFGRNSAVFVPFFAVPQAATITGASLLTKLSGSAVLPYLIKRKQDRSGYHIELKAPLQNFPTGDDFKDATFGNHIIEQSIMNAPGQYMWLHRRFKTRPNESDASLYENLGS